MHRFAPLLLASSGCTAAFSLDTQDLPIDVCGPYGTPEPVVFSGLTGPIDLSLDASATHGLVRVDLGEMDRTIVPIVLDTASGAYVMDAARAFAMMQATDHLHYGHITASINHPVDGGPLDPNVQADMFGSLRPPESNIYSLYHYHFTTATMPAGWTLAENPAVDASPNTSVYPGNELELQAGAGLFTRTATVVRIDQDTLAQTLDVDEFPLPTTAKPTPAWQVSMGPDGPVTAAINQFHAVDAGVIALGNLPSDGVNPQRHPLTLIYSGTPITEPDAARMLFFSYKHGDGTFPLGTKVRIAFPDGEYLEPWTTPDCLKLWFRRGDTIYRADTL